MNWENWLANECDNEKNRLVEPRFNIIVYRYYVEFIKWPFCTFLLSKLMILSKLELKKVEKLLIEVSILYIWTIWSRVMRNSRIQFISFCMFYTFCLHLTYCDIYIKIWNYAELFWIPREDTLFSLYSAAINRASHPHQKHQLYWLKWIILIQSQHHI